jgi:hypothetical protein
MASRDEGKGVLSRVVRMMSAPTRELVGLGADSGSSQFAEAEKAELKAMIERKRRNDFVRKRELNMLRRIRREGLRSEPPSLRAAPMSASRPRSTRSSSRWWARHRRRVPPRWRVRPPRARDERKPPAPMAPRPCRPAWWSMAWTRTPGR